MMNRRKTAQLCAPNMARATFVVLAFISSIPIVYSFFTVMVQDNSPGLVVFNASLDGKRSYKFDNHRTMSYAHQIVNVNTSSGEVSLLSSLICTKIVIYIESREKITHESPLQVIDYTSTPIQIYFPNINCPKRLEKLKWQNSLMQNLIDPIIVTVAMTRLENVGLCFRRSQLVLNLNGILPHSVRNCSVFYENPDDIRFRIEQNGGDVVSAVDWCGHEETWKIGVKFKLKCHSFWTNHALIILFHPTGVDNFDNNVERRKVMKRLRRTFENKSPYFESVQYTANVPEENEKGLIVTTVTASDPNHDPITYSMQAFMDTRSQNMFKIDQNTAIITTTIKLDRENMDMHVFRIIAIDNGDPPLSATTTLQINVIDENDHPPVFEQETYETSIRESVSVGSTVVTVRATDHDSGPNADIIYSILNSNGANEAMRIDSRSGILTTHLPLDREQTDYYKVLIQASDQGQLSNRKSATATVLVTVLDDNDNYPQFSQRTYTVTIPEDVDWMKNPVIALVNATDADIGANSVIRYSIIGGNTQGHFTIDSTNGHIRILSPLDYENMKSYRLIVRAQDSGSPSRSNTTQVLVNVKDVNDNEPKFYTAVFQESVTENVPIGTNIVRVQAYDADDGENAEITYSIQNGPDKMPIGIDNKTGWISTIRQVDREEKNVYNFIVQAIDHGNPPKTSTASVTVIVHDINDNDPVFEPKMYEAIVSETDPPGTSVISVTATDLDENPKLTYQITDGNTRGRFNINSQSGHGVISIAQPLDYKMEKYFELTVMAVDAGGRSSTALIKINVTDANTHRPMFEPTPYSVTVLEDVPVGTTVLVMSASDGDVGENARIAYSMDHVDQFEINPVSGAIVTVKELDRETKAGYTITVTAQDHGIPPLSDTTDVEIVILDVNDNPPKFSEGNYIGNVREDAVIGTSILQLSASDDDEGLNGRIRYTFVGGNDGNGFFNIDPTSGIVRIERLLDRETTPQYSLTAFAVDRGSPALQSAVNITVNVDDVNDNPPKFETDRFKLFIAENSPIGSTIGEIRAIDPDEGANAKIIYSIAGGPDASAFVLTSRGDVAELTSRVELDYESAKKKFELVIRAASPPLQNEANIEVWVQDVNDNAPVMEDFRIVFNNFKNHFPTDVIGKVPAFDADVSDNLTYRFVAGNNANLLLLNTTTGEIKLSRNLNTNVHIQATMEVSVSDGINEVRAECGLTVLLVTDAMLYNSVTVRLNDMTQEGFLSPLYNFFIEGLAAIIPCPKENIYIFNILDDTDVDARILNVSFSVKKSDNQEDYFYSPQYIMEKVYLNRAILAKLSTVKVLPFDDNLCVREPCPYFEECMSVLKFGNASGFISSNTILFRPIYPVNTFACTCPLGFTGMQKHYLCDSEVNLCYSNPCGQNGTCIQKEGGYTCVCKEGFTGKNCEVDMNEGTCSADICKGGSNCAKLIQGGFICENCPFFSFQNRICELTARRFIQGSFLTFPALRQRHRINIKLSFATRSKNALLLYNGRYNEKHDFIALEIINGGVQFSFSLGTEVSRVKTSIPNGVSDGEWHTVEVVYYNRTATLSLDNCDSVVAILFGRELGDYNCANFTTNVLEARCIDPTSTCHRFLDLTGPLQLGGLPSVPSDFQVTHKDFDGCLKDLYIDNEFIDLNAHVADNGTMPGCPERRQFCAQHPCKNGGTCREVWGRFLCNCPVGFGGKDCSEDLMEDLDYGVQPQKHFTGQSFLIFHSNLRVIQLPWSTNLSFRTWQMDSLLMRIQIGQSGEAVVELVNGHVRYRVNAEWLVLDQIKISDGQWHNIEVKWTTEGVWLTLDYGNYEKVGEFDSHVSGQYLGKVVVGGIESSEPNNNPLNFKGCLKDIRVGNRTSSWLRPVDEKNVQEGCPVTNSCLSSPCPVSSKCLDVFGVPKCTCLPGYFGVHCTDICRHNPCLNGGTCRRTKTKAGYTCYCDPQHGGPHCKEEVNQNCPTNWYGAPICGPCECDVHKGYDADCNKTTGECYCKENHYRPVDDEICYDCNCYLTGSFSKQCHPVTGQCKCRSGVIGRRCDSCSNPFAEVTLRGCEVIYDACPRSFSNGIWWERTYFGKQAIQNCPNKLQGKAERVCDADDGWEEANLFNCTSSAFADLRELLENLENKQLDMNTYLSVKISQDLLDATESTENLHGDDIFATIRLLTMVLTYETSQKGLNLTHRQDKDFIKNIVKSTSRILQAKYKEYWDHLSDLDGGSVDLVLHNFEEYGKVLANSQKDTFTRPFEETAENMVFGLDTVSLMEIRGMSLRNSVPSKHHPSFIDFTFPNEDQPSIVMPKYTNYPQKNNLTRSDVSVIIPLSALGMTYKTTPGVYSGESAKNAAVVSYTIYQTLGELLPRKYKSDVRQRWGTGLAVATSIISVNVASAKKVTHNLQKSVRVTFKLANIHQQMNPQCVFWKRESSGHGRWSTDGCETLIILDRSRNTTAVNCTCNHLSSFAVLIDLKDEEFVVKETLAESVVSYTCIVLSLILLFLAFVVFCALHGLQTNSNTIHKNMTICIFITELMFLIALKRRTDLIHTEFSCKIIAIFLHYFFLCEFSWVLLEAVHLYRMLTELRDINHGQMRFYYALGYGIPAIIVGLSVGVRADGYGNHIFCWLSIYETVIWSLVGPICCYVVINLLVFVLAIHASLQLKDEVEDFGSLRVLLWLGIALLPLMGATWILAMLAVNENVDYLYYLFEIFSLFQGLYVFLGYCVFNEKVRLQTVRTFYRLTGKKLPYEDNEVRTVNSGTNQKRSALAYHNRSFDVLHRTIGISTSSTTSRSTCKTSSSPYHTDSHFRNTSTSTPSNFNSFSDYRGKVLDTRSNLKNNHHKFDDPDTGEVNRKRVESDSDSEISIDQASLDLASSHSSDEDDYSKRDEMLKDDNYTSNGVSEKSWKRQNNEPNIPVTTNVPNIGMTSHPVNTMNIPNILSPPLYSSHWSSQGPQSFKTHTGDGDFYNQIIPSSWQQQGERLSVNTASDNEYPLHEENALESAFSQFSAPMIDDSPVSDNHPSQYYDENNSNALNDGASDQSSRSRASSKLAAILSGQKMFVPPLTMATDSDERITL